MYGRNGRQGPNKVYVVYKNGTFFNKSLYLRYLHVLIPCIIQVLIPNLRFIYCCTFQTFSQNAYVKNEWKLIIKSLETHLQILLKPLSTSLAN